MRHGRRGVQNDSVRTDLRGILPPTLRTGDLSLLGSISRPTLLLSLSLGSLFRVLKVDDAWAVHLRVLITDATRTPAHRALPTIVDISSSRTILPYCAKNLRSLGLYLIYDLLDILLCAEHEDGHRFLG